MRDDAGYDWFFLVGMRPVIDRGTACRLAEDDDSRWIASEASNVVSKPFDRGSLIAKASILFNAWRSREAKDAQAVVDGHDYYILVVCKILAVVEWAVWTGNSEAASMEEGKDGLLGLLRMCLRSRLGPDVQCETVFILLVPKTASKFVDDC